MGPGEAGSSSGGGGGDLGGGGGPPVGAAATTCSICLDFVVGSGGRSIAKLQCGHEFHLDCIGSAFNAKGVMQCPNCRQVEEGNWLSARRALSLPDHSIEERRYLSIPDHIIEDWPQDEDFYNLNNSEMYSRVQWCPFSQFAQVASSFEEGESSRSLDYQDLYDDDRSYPHISYFQLLQPPYSPNPHVSSETFLVGPAYYHQWSRVSEPMDAQIISPMSPYLPGYERHSPYFGPNIDTRSADHAPPSAATRTARLDSDVLPRAESFTSVPRHGSGSRANSSFAPSTVPPYVGNSSAYPHHRGHCHHQNSPAMPAPISDLQQSGVTRGLAPPIQCMLSGGGSARWGPQAVDTSNSSPSETQDGGSDGSSAHAPRMHHFI